MNWLLASQEGLCSVELVSYLVSKRVMELFSWLHAFITLQWLVRFTTWMSTVPGKEARFIGGWLSSEVWMNTAMTKKFLAAAGNKIPVILSLANHFTDWFTPAHICDLSIWWRIFKHTKKQSVQVTYEPRIINDNHEFVACSHNAHARCFRVACEFPQSSSWKRRELWRVGTRQR
jgi:hypothetical protein